MCKKNFHISTNAKHAINIYQTCKQEANQLLLEILEEK